MEDYLGTNTLYNHLTSNGIDNNVVLREAVATILLYTLFSQDALREPPFCSGPWALAHVLGMWMQKVSKCKEDLKKIIIAAGKGMEPKVRASLAVVLANAQITAKMIVGSVSEALSRLSLEETTLSMLNTICTTNFRPYLPKDRLDDFATMLSYRLHFYFTGAFMDAQSLDDTVLDSDGSEAENDHEQVEEGVRIEVRISSTQLVTGNRHI